MTIVKRGSKFRVVSEEGKNLGESKTKAGAAKRLGQVEWFKHHAKCVVDPSLVKSPASSNEGMQQYVPVVFQINKPQDKAAQKLDFPSTTKQMELRDVKQPEFPSTPFTGEAYAQSFHNPRPSNAIKDGTHVDIQGGKDTEYSPGSFRGEHGPDIQHKGSDYAPKRKSIMIAGRRVIIKGAEGSDNSNLRDYPIDRNSNPLDAHEESQKRKNFVRSEKIKEMKAYDDAKKNYAPGNGPFQLAMDTKTSYLGRGKDSKPIGEYTKEYPGAKVTFDQPIDPTKKPKKVFVHLTEHGRDVKAKRTSKSKGIMKIILQYTQNQPLAAGFKPLLAHLVKEEDNEDTDKAMTTSQIAEKIGQPKKVRPASASRIRLMERAAKEKTEDTSEDSIGPHPDFGPHGGYKGDTSKVGKGGFKDKWIKQQESKGKDSLEVPKAKKEKPNYKDPTTRMLMADDLYRPAGTKKSGRPDPIKGGIGDELDYKDVDPKELEEGIKVEQEHVGKNDDMDEDEKKMAGADIAMDHLAEDDNYYSKLAEMERTSKEGDKAETKKRKLLKIDQATKSFVFRSKGGPPIPKANPPREFDPGEEGIDYNFGPGSRKYLKKRIKDEDSSPPADPDSKPMRRMKSND